MDTTPKKNKQCERAIPVHLKHQQREQEIETYLLLGIIGGYNTENKIKGNRFQFYN